LTGLEDKNLLQIKEETIGYIKTKPKIKKTMGIEPVGSESQDI